VLLGGVRGRHRRWGDVHAPHLVLQVVQHLAGVLVVTTAAVVTMVRRGRSGVLLEEGEALHPYRCYGEVLLGGVLCE